MTLCVRCMCVSCSEQEADSPARIFSSALLATHIRRAWLRRLPHAHARRHMSPLPALLLAFPRRSQLRCARTCRRCVAACSRTLLPHWTPPAPPLPPAVCPWPAARLAAGSACGSASCPSSPPHARTQCLACTPTWCVAHGCFCGLMCFCGLLCSWEGCWAEGGEGGSKTGYPRGICAWRTPSPAMSLIPLLAMSCPACA